MKIHCPRCNQAIVGEDIDLAKDRALCRPCGELFSLSSPQPVNAEAVRRARPTDLRADVRHEGDSLVVSVTPERASALFGLAFSTVWFGFLFFWYSNALAHPSPSHVALWFPLLHVGAGFYMLWGTLRTLFNTTTLTLDRDALVVREGPVPAGGACDERTLAIARFAAGTRAMKRRGTTSNVAVVNAITQDGRAVCLDETEHAEWLAAELNEHLQLVQRPSKPKTYRA